MKKKDGIVVRIDDIEIRDRLRPADQASVDALAVDIAQRGLRTPIEIAKQKKGKPFRLIAGLHRISACIENGSDVITAFVVSGSNLELRRDELLENLTRNELSKLERAQFLAELKRVHLELFPEAGHGGDRRSDDFQDAKIASWSDVAAMRTGWKDRTLKLAVAIGEKLDPMVADQLRGSAIEDNQSELESLSKHGPSIQRLIVTQLTDPEKPAKTVAVARSRIDGTPAKEAKPDEVMLKKMMDIWTRAPKKVRNRFLQQINATCNG